MSSPRLAGLLALPLVLLLGACGMGDGIERDLRQLESHLDALGQQVDEHAHNVDRAVDQGAIAAEESAHDKALAEHMSGMRHEIDDMGGCMDENGKGPDTGSMSAHMNELAHECTGHGSAMDNAPDMGAAREEEHRHQAAMHEMIDRMRTDADGMMSDRGGMMADHDCGDDMHGM